MYRADEITRPRESTGRPAGLFELEGFYLDVVDDKVRSGSVRRKKEQSQVFVNRVPVYYERHGERGAPGRERITYWLFYGLSQPPGPSALLKHFVHEGDWERISVLLERSRDGASYTPISVRYHFHDENRDVPWHAVRHVAAEGGGDPTHPVVYVARASHASYPRAGEYREERAVAGKRVEAHDDAIACPDCPQWRTWQSLEDATRAAWYGFGGAWGTVGSQGGTTGPLGPSARKTCRAPRCPAVGAARR